jgi:hypothetical protein
VSTPVEEPTVESLAAQLAALQDPLLRLHTRLTAVEERGGGDSIALPEEGGEMQIGEQIFTEEMEEGGGTPHIVVPAGQIWRPIALACTLVTSAVAAKRSPHYGITPIAAGKWISYFFSPAVMEASLKFAFTVQFGGGDAASSVNFGEVLGGVLNGAIELPAPPMLMHPGNKLYIELLNEQAGDKYEGPSFTYERLR